MEEEGVEVPFDWEFKVEVDLFRVGTVPLDSELFDALPALLLFSNLEPIFLRRKSFRKGIFDLTTLNMP